jgi:hypothetical protein
MAFKMKPKSPLAKKLVGNQHKLPDHLKQEIIDAPESPMKKSKEDRIRGRKYGTTKNVTERLNEGDYKSARLERRGNVASSKGRKAKAKRLRRKADESSQKFFRDQVERRREK